PKRLRQGVIPHASPAVITARASGEDGDFHLREYACAEAFPQSLKGFGFQVNLEVIPLFTDQM
ncbi:MAG: hypothetical protein ABF334_06995, partial [Akkermansiaceae bacterium]